MSPRVARNALVAYHGLLALATGLLALGGVLTGDAALSLQLAAVAAAAAAVSWGLLRLKPWSWWGAVAAEVYGVVALVIWPRAGSVAFSFVIALLVAVLLLWSRPLFQSSSSSGPLAAASEPQ